MYCAFNEAKFNTVYNHVYLTITIINLWAAADITRLMY